ncbi:MAG: hypothetical protein JKY84_07285 [Emcibacteraceae bacterium]|nr:hypothetical protein [Emcibacteraceae bacterium]
MAFPDGWVYAALRVMASKVDIAHKRISDHELHVAEKYVRNENFMRLENQILKKLDSIERKIDAKADK